MLAAAAGAEPMTTWLKQRAVGDIAAMPAVANLPTTSAPRAGIGAVVLDDHLDRAAADAAGVVDHLDRGIGGLSRPPAAT